MEICFVVPLPSKLVPLLDFVVPLSPKLVPLSIKHVPNCEQLELLSFTTGEGLMQSLSYQAKNAGPHKETDSI
jgi:hypothetical protein